MALATKAAKDATCEELAEFLEFHGVAAPESIRGDKAELLDMLQRSRLPDRIIVSAVGDSPALQPSEDLSQFFIEPFDDTRERWCRIRIARDIHAEDEGSAVPVIHRTDLVFLPRNKDIVIRERFLRVLNDAKETRKRQEITDGFSTGGHFSSARAYVEERAPLQFFGTVGLVKDGPPKVPAGVHVYQQ